MAPNHLHILYATIISDNTKSSHIYYYYDTEQKSPMKGSDINEL